MGCGPRSSRPSYHQKTLSKRGQKRKRRHIKANAAERKHVIKERGNKNYRVKKVCKLNKDTSDTSYEPGFEPIE